MSAASKSRRENPGERIRAARGQLSLDAFADLIAREGCPRPSVAKLSRIETGVQPVPIDIVSAVEKLTGIPIDDLRPDWAAKFGRRRGRAA